MYIFLKKLEDTNRNDKIREDVLSTVTKKGQLVNNLKRLQIISRTEKWLQIKKVKNTSGAGAHTKLDDCRIMLSPR